MNQTPLPFTDLPLQSALLDNLDTMGFTSMTPIQAQSLPPILDGRDVIAQAKTGSGKTAAFGLGLLQKLDVKLFRIQSLVLCPTRELADQVANELRRFARGIHNIKILTLCGGTPIRPQILSLEHGAHIIVGTPGRIVDHLERGRLDLSHLNLLVLDEADRMLEMGFQPALDAIFLKMPAKRQSLLFSATFSKPIQQIARQLMDNPTSIIMEEAHDQLTIEQQFFKVSDHSSRLLAIRLLLLHFRPESAVIFCNTKRDVQDVANELNARRFDVLALHGDMEQRDRDETLVRFSNKSASVLVATDVAARGLDIDSLDAVINFQMAFDPEIHIHRVGRTGRAGSKGLALTLFNDQDDYRMALVKDSLGPLTVNPLPHHSLLESPPYYSPMTTLRIDGGKRQKLRAGDILGALTGDKSIAGADVGRIQIFDNWSYVAIRSNQVKTAVNKLTVGKLKGRSFTARVMH